MRVIFYPIITAIILTFSSSSFAQEAISKNFKDWKIECDKYNSCIASTLSSKAKDNYTLALSRGDYQDYWEISLISNDKQPAQNSTITIALDGQELTFLSGHDFAAYDALNQYYFLGENAQLMLDMLMPSSKAQISFDKIVADFSLSGLSASLLFIDERQDNIGLKRIAGEPPRDKILVTSRKPEAFPNYLMSEHKNPKFLNCDPIDELAHGTDMESFRLDATSTLFLVPCTAGAYNFSYVAYIKDEYETKMQFFASYWEGNGWSGTQYLVNPYFDEKTNILVDFYKGRGIGDCGTRGNWVWNKYSFKLLEYSAKSECDGEAGELEEVGDFPIIYRDKNYTPIQ